MSSVAKAVYAFSGEGQAVPLPLAETVVVLVVERNQDGWCRGFSCGKEGWFPASYVKDIPESTITNVSASFKTTRLASFTVLSVRSISVSYFSPNIIVWDIANSTRKRLAFFSMDGLCHGR